MNGTRKREMGEGRGIRAKYNDIYIQIYKENVTMTATATLFAN